MPPNVAAAQAGGAVGGGVGVATGEGVGAASGSEGIAVARVSAARAPVVPTLAMPRASTDAPISAQAVPTVSTRWRGPTLGRLTGGPRRRGRRGAETAALAEAKPRRQRKPITDPEQLERRRQALAKARAAKLTARREEAASD